MFKVTICDLKDRKNCGPSLDYRQKPLPPCRGKVGMGVESRNSATCRAGFNRLCGFKLASSRQDYEVTGLQPMVIHC